MRIFYSEFNSNYSTYTFGYAVYAIADKQEEIEEIYEKGFLPYSADISKVEEIFYLCRSLRVRLSDFSDSSENKRINRKMEGLEPELECIALKDFDINNADFQAFCLHYAKERFVGGSLSQERWAYILKRGNGTHILRFRRGGKVLGYVLVGLHGGAVHYWFSFYDLEISQDLPLGKWLMWRTIKWAQDEGREFVYLGTCYKESGLYKVRDHKGVEYFNGSGWSNDTVRLKELCKSDGGEHESDIFKRG